MNINNARSPHGLTRQQLERSWQRSNRLNWGQILRSLGTRAVAALTQGQAPRVSSVTTEEGMQWRVYDPVGDRTHYFATETEVRTWLNQRYNLP